MLISNLAFFFKIEGSETSGWINKLIHITLAPDLFVKLNKMI